MSEHVCGPYCEALERQLRLRESLIPRDGETPLDAYLRTVCPEPTTDEGRAFIARLAAKLRADV